LRSLKKSGFFFERSSVYESLSQPHHTPHPHHHLAFSG
jgi:hypothetical protein